MKLMESIVLSEIGDSTVAVPVGPAAEKFHGVIRLNETSADIVRGLAEGLDEETIAAKLLDSYSGVDRDGALAAVSNTVKKLRDVGLIVE